MIANVTVTGKTGPAVALTAALFTNVSNINFNLAAQVLSFTKSNNQIEEIDLSNIATVTVTISGQTWTVAVSS